MSAPTLSKYIKDTTARYPRELWVIDRILAYTEFWDSTPILAHFVPTSKEGVPLEKPEGYDNWMFKSIMDFKDPMAKVYKEYQEAESRLRWEGWKLTKRITKNEIRLGDWHMRFYKNGTVWIWNSKMDKKTLFYGDLITANIPLEPVNKVKEDLNLN